MENNGRMVCTMAAQIQADALDAAARSAQGCDVTSIFLTQSEVCELTARKKKSAQALELKRMKIQHWINAAGQPVVPRSAIEGRNVQATSAKQEWKPAALSA